MKSFIKFNWGDEIAPSGTALDDAGGGGKPGRSFVFLDRTEAQVVLLALSLGLR